MKQTILFIAFLFNILLTHGQVNCPLNTPEFPFTTDDNWNTYSWSANLYHPNQMGGAQTINSISFRLDNDNSWGNYTYSNVKVWVRNSTITNYASSTGYPGNVGFTQVYNGNLTFNGSGTYTINFSSGFSYDGTSHYEVLFENIGGTDNTSEEPWFDRTNATVAGVFPGKVGWGTSWSNAKTTSTNRQFNLQIDNLGCASIPLPVNLTAHNLECNDKDVVFTWTTETEINNNFFTIESSNDGKNWIIEQLVDGQGNSRKTQKYRVQLDNLPLSKYYRLSQTDFDGTHKNLVTHVPNCGQDKIFTIYPNPASTSFSLSSDQSLNIGELKIYNYVGKEVFNYTVNNNIINSSNFAKGLYLVKVGNTTRRLMVK
jgi:hypothetical protein